MTGGGQGFNVFAHSLTHSLACLLARSSALDYPTPLQIFHHGSILRDIGIGPSASKASHMLLDPLLVIISTGLYSLFYSIEKDRRRTGAWRARRLGFLSSSVDDLMCNDDDDNGEGREGAARSNGDGDPVIVTRQATMTAPWTHFSIALVEFFQRAAVLHWGKLVILFAFLDTVRGGGDGSSSRPVGRLLL